MSLTYQHAHGLGAAEARRRLLSKAAEHGVEVAFDPGSKERGEVRAASPLGKVVARFAIGDAALDVEVVKKPAFVSGGMVRSALQEGLSKILG
ncbi:MAG: hypothetical protein P1V81_01505 [Planctomycetota bacterium]|nr:hypothetical protein [Planctomycetota bacterium]